MSRFTSVFNNAGTKALIAGDDGIFINGGNVTIADGLPIGFQFALRTTSAAGFNIAWSNEEVFDNNGNQTNTYGNPGLHKGEYVEIVKVTATQWFAIVKLSDWAST